MNYSGKYLAIAAEERPTVGTTLKEAPMKGPWWSGVIVDSILGFSATLVFVLAGVLFLRKRLGQRGHPKYSTKPPSKLPDEKQQRRS